MIRSKDTIATPPGATIKEQLVDRGMSQKEFASRMEMSEKHISKLINGEVMLTSDVAMRLEMVLGLPARFWNNLEAIYREKIAAVQAENEMEEDKELAGKFPYKEMAKYGWVPETTKAEEKVINLRKHFEVVHLAKLDAELLPKIAARRQEVNEKTDFALMAWAQRAKIEARKIETRPINIDRLIAAIPQIREMTRKAPEEFCPELIELFSNCGIALVFLPHIGGSFLHGATFFDKNKIVIGLTVRGKDADKFWFSLFHEIGHIVKGHLSNIAGTTEDDEHQADEYARAALIPEDEFQTFMAAGDYSTESMKGFADKIGIDVGIVVGRLQKDGKIKYNLHNDLKTRYELTA